MASRKQDRLWALVMVAMRGASRPGRALAILAELTAVR
jgi:hypothetical protein